MPPLSMAPRGPRLLALLLAVSPGCNRSDPNPPSLAPAPAPEAPEAPKAPEAPEAPEAPAPTPAEPTERALEAAGLRVLVPADWQVEVDDPWSARARAPTGDLRCMIEWWPAGFVPDRRHRELPGDGGPSRTYEHARGESIRALERGPALLACAWAPSDAGAAERVDRIFGSLAVVDAPARPPGGESPYRDVCTFTVDVPRAPDRRRVLALGRDGVAWLGDLDHGTLRRLDGDGHRAIACEIGRGLLLRGDQAVVAIGRDWHAGTDSDEPVELAAPGEVVAIGRQFFVRRDGRATWWSDRYEPQTVASRIPARRARPTLAAWGTWAGGCVLTDSATLWCWSTDEEPLTAPPLRFPGPGRLVNTHTGESEYGPTPFELPLFLDAPSPVPPIVARRGEAMCVRIADAWTCLDRADRTRTIPACSAQPCRCRAARCSDAPLDTVTFGSPQRRDEVLLASDGCVVVRDGALICDGATGAVQLRPPAP